MRERAREKRQREVKVSRERARMRARASEREKILPTKQAGPARDSHCIFFMKKEKKIYPPSQLGKPGILGTSGI